MEIRSRQGGEFRNALDRDHLLRERAQNRRVIARAGADVEHFFRAAQFQPFRHQRRHVRLGDGLTVADGERRVDVRVREVHGVYEFFTRNEQHRIEHSLVANAAAAQLIFEHVDGGRAAHPNLSLTWSRLLAVMPARMPAWPPERLLHGTII